MISIALLGNSSRSFASLREEYSYSRRFGLGKVIYSREPIFILQKWDYSTLRENGVARSDTVTFRVDHYVLKDLRKESTYKTESQCADKSNTRILC